MGKLDMYDRLMECITCRHYDECCDEVFDADQLEDENGHCKVYESND